MRRSRKLSEKKRRSKVSRRNSRKPNYSQRNYRRKTRKTRKTRQRKMTRKKLYGGAEAEAVVGLCKKQCGRKVTEGLTPRGKNPYDTCCQDCARRKPGVGGPHSEECDRRAAEPEPEPAEPEPAEPEPAEPELGSAEERRAAALRKRERRKAREAAEAPPPAARVTKPHPPFGETMIPGQGLPAVFSVYSHIDSDGVDVYKAYSPKDNYKIYKAIIEQPDHGEVNVTEPRTNKGLNEDGQPHIRKLFFGEKAGAAYQDWVDLAIFGLAGGEHIGEERVMYNQLIQSSVSGDPDIAFVRIGWPRMEASPYDTGMISCFKQKPSVGSWPERRMQIKDQSLRFYDVGDTTLRGSSITDLTGAIITSYTEKWPIKGEKLIITIKPNLILNLPEGPEPRPFKVEANHSTATYPGQTKTVALDSEGETKIALPLDEGTEILEKLRGVTGAEITYREPEPEPVAGSEAEPLSEKQRAIAEAMARFAETRLDKRFGIGDAEVDVKWAKGAATPVVRGWTADDQSIPSEECE
jgi:hypothetical protein